MTKNATPHQIALYCVALITATVSLLLLGLKYFQLIIVEWYTLIGILIFLVITSYLVVIYLLREYIYRRVKLIYKSIHRFKLSTQDRAQDIDLATDILGDVQKEVARWAFNQQKEIQSLKSMETYRRNFVGNVSHELKTPIFNIQGYVHTLLDGGLYDENINMSYLEKAARNIERLQTIVDDLEAISRLESGELTLEMQQFDISRLVQEVYEEMETIAHRKSVSLQFKTGADGAFQVIADRESIRRVLNNLVVNAIKYGKAGGVVKTGMYDMGNYILVEVADNGIGISEEHLIHVFDRFYRADKSRSRDLGGSGLGLAIVKHIIEAHNQTINVRSTMKLGSTFGFTLKKA